MRKDWANARPSDDVVVREEFVVVVRKK